jgi:4-amino-4-deoxy-L-arabinose transferase-like glycosyltransferase
MQSRYGTAILALLALVVALSFLGSHGLFEPSEGRYAEVSREMLESGDFLEPTVDYHPHWTKPPLTYWTAAAGMELFGRNAWGARFFGAVAFVLTVLAVAGIGTRLWDSRTGFLAGLVYLSSLFPVLAASLLTTDTLLTLWATLALFSFVAAWRSDSARARGWWVRAMWLCFGLGFFTKGPPALLPLLIVIVFAVGARRLGQLFDVAGVAAFLVVGLWWYAAVSLRNPGLLDYFLKDEIVGRNLTDEFHRNPQWYGPLVVYIPPLLVGLGPWLVEAVRGVRRSIRLRGEQSLWGAASSARRLLLLWVAVPLVVLSISKSRLPLYVLPLMAPIALAAAAAARRSGKRRVAALAIASVVVCLAAKASIPLFDRHNNAELIHDAAVAAGGPGARYAFLDERYLYGVQFYFDGAIERVFTSVPPGQPDTRRTLDTVLSDFVASGDARPLVFITHATGAAAVEREVRDLHGSVSRSQFEGREIVVVSK